MIHSYCSLHPHPTAQSQIIYGTSKHSLQTGMSHHETWTVCPNKWLHVICLRPKANLLQKNLFFQTFSACSLTLVRERTNLITQNPSKGIAAQSAIGVSCRFQGDLALDNESVHMQLYMEPIKAPLGIPRALKLLIPNHYLANDRQQVILETSVAWTEALWS